MARHDNVTTLLYRRRASGGDKPASPEPAARPMAFDPLLVFTAVLVAAAALSQVFFLLAMEF